MHVSVRAAARARRIGELVREERKAQGLRQDDLALACGPGERTIHAIERGKPTIAFAALYSVLEVLGLDVMVCPRQPASGRIEVRLRD
jgi:y4mF family transcriptional regulator